MAFQGAEAVHLLSLGFREDTPTDHTTQADQLGRLEAMLNERCGNDKRVLTRNPKPVVYACSGCSDAGELADRIARHLTREGVAEMSCLAGIGGRVKHLVAVAKRAERILVIDGCPINCARKAVELAGVCHFEHLSLDQLGWRKGSCPVNDENLARGLEAARRKLVSVEGKGLA